MELIQTNNPFAQEHQAPTITTPNHGALANTDTQRAVAEVQVALMIARLNPRNPRQTMDNILNACTRPSLAESAIYTYARGGSNITGPSIRLAEAIAQYWGNVQFGIREISQENGSSTVQAYAWDVETNTRREMVFQVSHKRHTKNGSYDLKDSRDIYEHVANQGARRLRACILSVIPGDVVEAAVQQCDLTLCTKFEVTPENIKRLIEGFEAFGVTKEQIEKRIQRRIDSIQPAQIAQLRKIYTSINDGMSTPSDWFESRNNIQADKPAPIENDTKTDGIKQAIKSRQKKQLAETQAVTEPTPEISQPATAELTEEYIPF